jgi:hypothetical protein
MLALWACYSWRRHDDDRGAGDGAFTTTWLRDLPMPTPNEFWLDLHTLSEAYNAEGLTADERSRNIMDEFRRMPPTVRRSVLLDLQQLTSHFDDLLVTARIVALEEDRNSSAAVQSKSA